MPTLTAVYVPPLTAIVAPDRSPMSRAWLDAVDVATTSVRARLPESVLVFTSRKAESEETKLAPVTAMLPDTSVAEIAWPADAVKAPPVIVRLPASAPTSKPLPVAPCTARPAPPMKIFVAASIGPGREKPCCAPENDPPLTIIVAPERPPR